MNLQPLYDVKERLESAAIAGAGLLGEDFRLQRAAEAMKPLAAASPVIGKISAGLDKLLSAPAGERSGLLLDLLALVDAVACTQGRTGLAGELEPLPTGSGTYCQISYGQLQPLAAALTTTGGGRMEIVQDAWNNHPEYFSDFRVLPLLVQDLEDRYSYLANLNVNILVSLGPVALPLLKEGFDPAGKSDMARRVEAIERIAGAAENEFYLEMLPKAKRDVQMALISALRHDPSNGPALAELCRTKKGDAQEWACRALARSNAPEAQAYFEQLAAERPNEALKYLAHVPAEVEWAGRFTARLFQAELDRVDADPELPLTLETQERYRLLFNALCGKTGPEIWDVYRRAAALGERLERNREGSKEPMKFDVIFGLPTATPQKNFRWTLSRVLEGMVMRRGDLELQKLAMELYEQYGNHYLSAALTVQLFTLDSAACYEWAERRFYKTSPQGERTVCKEVQDVYNRVFSAIKWDPRDERYFVANQLGPPSDGDFYLTRRLDLDLRWFGLFASAGLSMRHLLLGLLREQRDKPEILAQMGSRLYQMALTDSANITHMYVEVLAGLGWTDWTGFIVERGRRVGRFLDRELKLGMEALPIPLEEKISQLDKLADLARQNKFRIQYAKEWPEEEIQRWITQWKREQAKGENGNG